MLRFDASEQLQTQITIAAANAAMTGRWLLAATLYRAVAELELEAQIQGDPAAEIAWNQRTTNVPKLSVPMRSEHPRTVQNTVPCGICDNPVNVELNAWHVGEAGNARPWINRGHMDNGLDLHHVATIDPWATGTAEAPESGASSDKQS